MKILYILRTNLTNLEYYHSYSDLETFKLNCHDYYLNIGIWLLENNYFNEVIIWRLSNTKHDDIIFNINGKKFIQKWVNNFNEVFKYLKPDITFFRGGFLEYCEITKRNPKFFGLKLYLAAGKRLLPQYGGIYDKILIEDERDYVSNSIPFYKTTNPNVFKPLNLNKKYDICIISNFTQLKYKGFDFIITEIAKNSYLQNLKICHIGNKKDVGIQLCKQKNINNIEFLGQLERIEINKVLNESKFGIVASNQLDGCPRVITEILTSGTPLLLKDSTRLLNYYKKYGVVQFNDRTFLRVFMVAYERYENLKKDLIDNLNRFSMDEICKKNIDLWR